MRKQNGSEEKFRIQAVIRRKDRAVMNTTRIVICFLILATSACSLNEPAEPREEKGLEMKVVEKERAQFVECNESRTGACHLVVKHKSKDERPDPGREKCMLPNVIDLRIKQGEKEHLPKHSPEAYLFTVSPEPIEVTCEPKVR